MYRMAFPKLPVAYIHTVVVFLIINPHSGWWPYTQYSTVGFRPAVHAQRLGGCNGGTPWHIYNFPPSLSYVQIGLNLHLSCRYQIVFYFYFHFVRVESHVRGGDLNPRSVAGESMKNDMNRNLTEFYHDICQGLPVTTRRGTVLRIPYRMIGGRKEGRKEERKGTIQFK